MRVNAARSPYLQTKETSKSIIKIVVVYSVEFPHGGEFASVDFNLKSHRVAACQNTAASANRAQSFFKAVYPA